jgi:hypothetical protein
VTLDDAAPNWYRLSASSNRLSASSALPAADKQFAVERGETPAAFSSLHFVNAW